MSQITEIVFRLCTAIGKEITSIETLTVTPGGVSYHLLTSEYPGRVPQRSWSYLDDGTRFGVQYATLQYLTGWMTEDIAAKKPAGKKDNARKVKPREASMTVRFSNGKARTKYYDHGYLPLNICNALRDMLPPGEPEPGFMWKREYGAVAEET